jgi:ABC-2 type transport system ATP-binding protein
MIDNAVETYLLNKIYFSSFGKKKVNALNELNLSVKKGTIFGLLGPNGAGKTTLIKILLGITFPTSGTASILGEDISNFHVKQLVGYLPENHKYPAYLTGESVLYFFGRLSGLAGVQLKKRSEELLNLVKLSEWKKTKVKNYSKGMMQRLGLAQALLNDPELLFLDEPTDGVDPIGRKEIRDILIELKNRGKTIFLNSHLLSEVELITDRVGILNKGKLLREGNVKELTERKEEYKIRFGDESINLLNPEMLARFSLIKINDDYYSLRLNSGEEVNKIIDGLRAEGISIKEFVQQKNTLEDMFISLIKESELEQK